MFDFFCSIAASYTTADFESIAVGIGTILIGVGTFGIAYGTVSLGPFPRNSTPAIRIQS